MTATVAALYRHPVKGLGFEPMARFDLTADAPVPGDRAYALLHAGAEYIDTWQPRRNFLVVAYGPDLARIRVRTEADGRLTLSHPERPDLTVDPDTEGPALRDWVRPLWPAQHSAPHRLVTAPAESMADNGLAQVSILNLATLADLSARLGQDLQIERFRGNIVLDGLAPWAEFNLVGETVAIGGATFAVTERIERCRATEANPLTGQRDANTLRALEEGWGHRDFGIYATVTGAGAVALGDALARL